MSSFGDALKSALNSEFQLTLDGYELFELYHLLLSQPPKDIHLRVIARELFDIFFDRVSCLSSLPFPEVVEDE